MKKAQKKESRKAETDEREPVPPLKPRPRLFMFMSIVLVILMAGLLTLYFKTVYPYRTIPHAVEIDKVDEPGSAR